MKTLVKNESKAYSSEVVLHGENKFKIVARNGNAYCDLDVYVMTKNGDFAHIACLLDIPNAVKVDYIYDEKRLSGNAKNLLAAKEYIKIVYN